MKTSTDTIILNSLDIDIKSVIFNDNNGKVIPTKQIEVCSPEETATLVFEEQLPLGRSGYLSLEFVGEINDKMKGFYRSKYIGYSDFYTITIILLCTKYLFYHKRCRFIFIVFFTRI